MATPLLPGGYEVDREALPALVNFLVDAGVQGIFAGGTTGEGLVLDVAQRQRLHELSAQLVNERVPLFVHVGANTARDTLALAQHAAGLGVDGVVCITPTFYGMPDQDLLAYFQEIARVTPETPFFVYDIPHLASTGVSPALLGQLIETIPNFGGVKCSRSDAQVIRHYVAIAGEAAMVFAGNERIALGSLALGVTGLISGMATAIPEPFVSLTAAFAAGDLAAAQEQQRRINCLLDRVPASRRIGSFKTILQQRGLQSGPMVPPRMLEEDPALWSDLAALL